MREEAQRKWHSFFLKDNSSGGISNEVKRESVLGNLQKVISLVHLSGGYRCQNCKEKAMW
jgi:hypothetical protein